MSNVGGKIQILTNSNIEFPPFKQDWRKFSKIIKTHWKFLKKNRRINKKSIFPTRSKKMDTFCSLSLLTKNLPIKNKNISKFTVT